MADKLKLFDLPPSPNNMKAHIALNYKELAWDRVLVDMQDRSELVKATGQPLTPVLVHGDRIVYDSGAILRYLDANFPKTRRLYATDREAMRQIEQWELFSRTDMSRPVATIFGEAFAEKRDASIPTQASGLLAAATARIEERLAQGKWLVGDNLTAADVTNAPWVYYGMLSEQEGKQTDIHRFFADSLKLGTGRDRTRDWVKRVMAYNS